MNVRWQNQDSKVLKQHDHSRSLLFMYVVSIGVIIAIWQMFILVMQGAASLLKTILSSGS